MIISITSNNRSPFITLFLIIALAMAQGHHSTTQTDSSNILLHPFMHAPHIQTINERPLRNNDPFPSISQNHGQKTNRTSNSLLFEFEFNASMSTPEFNILSIVVLCIVGICFIGCIFSIYKWCIKSEGCKRKRKCLIECFQNSNPECAICLDHMFPICCSFCGIEIEEESEDGMNTKGNEPLHVSCLFFFAPSWIVSATFCGEYKALHVLTSSHKQYVVR